MKVSLITFSPTGGTLSCAKYIAEGIGEVCSIVDLTDRNKTFDITIDYDSLALFAVPAYGGRIPTIAVDRLKQIRGNNTDAALVAVYGNREIDDTLIELYDIVSTNGFKVKAAISAVAEHSLVRSYGNSRPDELDKAELIEFGNRIASSNTYLDSVPGKRPYKNFGGCPARPITDKDKCVSCSLCFKKCPVGAISESDYSSVDNSKCIACMRCISICPKMAKSIDPAIEKNIDKMLSAVAQGRKANELFI